MKKVNNLKNQKIPTRQPLARAFENSKAKERRLLEQTSEDALNKFRQKTSLNNIFRCFVCTRFRQSSEVVEFDEEEMNIENVDVDEAEKMKLNGKLWRCSTSCTVKEAAMESHRLVKLRRESTEMYTKFVPVIEADSNEVEDSFDSQTDVPDTSVESFPDFEKPITVLFPNCPESLNIIFPGQEMKDIKLKHIEDVKVLVNSGNLVGSKELEILYTNQLSKYFVVLKNADVFQARVIDPQNKIVESLKKTANDQKIPGSKKWNMTRLSDISAMMSQYGQYAMKVEARVPIASRDVLASTLVQNGISISVDYVAVNGLETEVVYWVHNCHSAQEFCHPDCTKIRLEEYLENTELDTSQLSLTAFLSSINQKCNAFIQHILKCQSSSLASDEYYFYVQFSKVGEATIVGVCWPVFMREINCEVVTAPCGSSAKRSELVDLIDKAVTTSSNERILKSQFHLSGIEASELLKVVNKHQVHLSEDCPHCNDPEPPSMMTMIQEPTSSRNLENSEQLMLSVKLYLLRLSIEEKKNVPTFKFLENFFNEKVSKFEHSDGVVKMIVDNNIIKFEEDERMNDLKQQFDNSPFSAVYHYALGSCETEKQSQIILKRLKIIDCFTFAYNPLFLKAFESTILVKPVFDSKDCSWELNYYEDESNDGTQLKFHSEISMIEAMSLSDSRKCQVRSSRPVEFVYAAPETTIRLKRASPTDAECFKEIGKQTAFKEMMTIVKRYFLRANGEKMLLSEFVLWYDYCGEKESEELFKVYGSLEHIKTSETIKSIVDDCPLPSYVVCTNRDVLQLRKRMKVLKPPNFTSLDAQKYCETLLFFHPLETNNMNKVTIDRLHSKRVQHSEETIVASNRR